MADLKQLAEGMNRYLSPQTYPVAAKPNFKGMD